MIFVHICAAPSQCNFVATTAISWVQSVSVEDVTSVSAFTTSLPTTSKIKN